MYSFVVLCPTIRPSEMTKPAFDRMRDTFTQPTDYYILDGSDGVAQTLNRALKERVDPTRHDFYVRVDDDWYAPDGWQDAIIQAYQDIAHLGLSGIDLIRDTSAHAQKCMHFAQDARTTGKTTIREILSPHNLAGGCYIMPTLLAKAVGDMPVIGETKYQIYGSMWLSRAVRRIGFRTAFICTEDTARLLEYDDSEEHTALRDKDTQTWVDSGVKL
jgi:hypothetical protein